MHQLVEKNKTIIDSLISTIKSYNIKGVYVKNPHDISVFSDIDIYVVCENSSVETLFNEKEKIFNSVGPTLVVWGNKFSNNKYSINVVFRTEPIPLKIDVNIKTIDDIQPSEKLKDCEILYDSDNLLLKAKEGSQSIDFTYVPDKIELQRMLNAFCGWIFNTLSKIKKTDYASVVFEHEVDYIKNIILPLYFSLSEGKQEGLYNAKSRIDQTLLEKIKLLKLKQEEYSLVNDLKIIVEIYEELAEKVCVKYQLTYPKIALSEIKNILENFAKY